MNVHAAYLRQTFDLGWKEEDVPNNVRTVQFSGAVTSEACMQCQSKDVADCPLAGVVYAGKTF